MSKGIDYSRFDNIDVTDSEEEEEEEEVEEKESWNDHPTDSGLPVQELEDGWIQVGHVKVHPKEKDTYLDKYPLEIFTEDPNTFAPNPAEFEDGIVKDWGIPSEQDDAMKMVQRMMMREQSDRTYAMSKEDNPVKQFVKILEQRKDAFTSTPKVQGLTNSTFYLKVSLLRCERDVWRIARVPAAIDLAKLHDQVLVPIMGWSRGYHGYAFEDPKDGAVLGPQKYGSFIDMMHAPHTYHHIMEDQRYPLAGLLQNVGDYIFYTYDLGDRWRHRIELLDIVSLDHPKDKTQSAVHLLDGFGACPPEDGNGLERTGCYGYEQFLRDYKANPRCPEMKKAVREVETKAVNYSKPWDGRQPLKFHPLDFDIKRHRHQLELMLAGPFVQKKGDSIPGQSRDDAYKHSNKSCAGCGDRIKALKKCSNCGAWYCSRQCQEEDWKNHKKKCRERAAKKTDKKGAASL